MTTLAMDRLVTDVRPAVTEAIDVLHVAAILESRGVTDELARTRYDSEDVFDLATRVRERVRGVPMPGGRGGVTIPHPGSVSAPVRRQPFVATDVSWGRSTVGHGAIYLLPALSMPALLALVGTRYVVLALIVGGAIGWAWAVVATWRAYVVWSNYGREAARRLLRQLTLVGVVVGVGVAAVLVRGLELPPVVGVVAAAITTGQLGTTLLFFLRRRVLLTTIFVVPAALGGAWLARPDLVPAAAVLAVFVSAGVLSVAVGTAALLRPAPALPDRPQPRPEPVRFAWVTAYAVASVAFLLLPQAVLLTRHPIAVVALAGLFVAMGVVEWRSSRLSENLRRLLATEHRVGRFRVKITAMVVIEAVACAVTGAATSALVLYAMDRLGVLSPVAASVAVVAVPLAAVYLLAVILANTGAYHWLATAFGLGALIEAVGPQLLDTSIVPAFGAATVTVLAVLLYAATSRPLHRYR